MAKSLHFMKKRTRTANSIGAWRRWEQSDASSVQTGLCQTGFHSVLAGSCSRQAEERHKGIAIRTLKREDYRLYGDIYTESFGMPAFLKESVATNNAVLHEERNWTFYLAEVEEEPAGVAALFTSGSIAVLAACAVLARFRKQGVQQALISRRQADAAAVGCTYICGQAGFATKPAQYGAVRFANHLYESALAACFIRAVP